MLLLQDDFGSSTVDEQGLLGASRNGILHPTCRSRRSGGVVSELSELRERKAGIQGTVARLQRMGAKQERIDAQLRLIDAIDARMKELGANK